MTQGRRVHSVEKAITLLDCFWQAQGPLSLSEQVQETGWAQSTIHGILASMLDSAVVEQSRTDGKYQLGYHLFELGCSVSAGWDVIALAKPRMLHIVATLNESANLARLSGEDLVLVDCAEPHVGFRVASENGCRIPLHCSSQGKAILAYRSPAEARALLSRAPLHPHTPYTITDVDQLLSQLQTVRTTGLAEEYEEFRPGLHSVAAPIFDSRGACDYALSVIGVTAGATPEKLQQVRAAVSSAAQAISHELGYRGKKAAPAGSGVHR